MTTANKVTIGRILLVPFFVVQVIYYVNTGREMWRWLAISCFAAAAISDGIDGFLARHFNQRSELGAVLDPLADKLLLLSAIILLSLHNEPHLQQIPVWLTVTIISRDLLLVLGVAVMHYVVGKVAVKPHLTGKAATVLQMAAVLWALFKLDSRTLYFLCVAAAVLTGISGLFYIYRGVQQLGKHPASLATGTRSTRNSSTDGNDT
jgi:CDP-diacylglycerol--glycerol-3-phosphate 3-phosphatidyltransferase